MKNFMIVWVFGFLASMSAKAAKVEQKSSETISATALWSADEAMRAKGKESFEVKRHLIANYCQQESTRNLLELKELTSQKEPNVAMILYALKTIGSCKVEQRKEPLGSDLVNILELLLQNADFDEDARASIIADVRDINTVDIVARNPKLDAASVEKLFNDDLVKLGLIKAMPESKPLEVGTFSKSVSPMVVTDKMGTLNRSVSPKVMTEESVAPMSIAK
jgi:hypothetical protein